jgi:hypothetical protein
VFFMFHVDIMHKYVEKTSVSQKAVDVSASFYLPHMEYEGSIGFVMRKMKNFYC